MSERLKAEVAHAQALRETARGLRAEMRAATMRMRMLIAEARSEVRGAREQLDPTCGVAAPAED